MIRNSLFNEEIRRKDIVGNDTRAIVTENRGQSKSKEPYGHNKSRGRSKSRGKIKCYHCGKIGRMKRNCRILKQGVARMKISVSTNISVLKFYKYIRYIRNILMDVFT